MRTRFVWVSVYGACALISLSAHAQAGSVAPEIKYLSAFESYVPYREQPLASWRDVNDEARRVGGHAGIFSGGHHVGSQAEASAPLSGAPAKSAREASGHARRAPEAPRSHPMGH